MLLGIALALLAAAHPAPVDDEVAIHLRVAERPHGTRQERVRLRDLEYEIMARLAGTGAGIFARDAWENGACVLVLNGKDAGAIWAAIEDAVRAYRPLPGSFALLRSGAGPPERVELGDGAR